MSQAIEPSLTHRKFQPFELDCLFLRVAQQMAKN